MGERRHHVREGGEERREDRPDAHQALGVTLDCPEPARRLLGRDGLLEVELAPPTVPAGVRELRRVEALAAHQSTPLLL